MRFDRDRFEELTAVCESDQRARCGEAAEEPVVESSPRPEAIAATVEAEPGEQHEIQIAEVGVPIGIGADIRLRFADAECSGFEVIETLDLDDDQLISLAVRNEDAFSKLKGLFDGRSRADFVAGVNIKQDRSRLLPFREHREAIKNNAARRVVCGDVPPSLASLAAEFLFGRHSGHRTASVEKSRSLNSLDC